MLYAAHCRRGRGVVAEEGGPQVVDRYHYNWIEMSR